MKPGIETNVMAELLPSSIKEPALVFILLKLSLFKIISVAVIKGTYIVLFLPFIFTSRLSLFFKDIVILNLPVLPLISLGFNFWSFNSYCIFTDRGKFLLVSPW